jgi:hypothetical protein
MGEDDRGKSPNEQSSQKSMQNYSRPSAIDADNLSLKESIWVGVGVGDVPPGEKNGSQPPSITRCPYEHLPDVDDSSFDGERSREQLERVFERGHRRKRERKKGEWAEGGGSWKRSKRLAGPVI